MTIQIELESLRKETDVASVERKEKLEQSLQSKEDEAANLTQMWEKEKAEIDAIKNARSELETARIALEQAQRDGDYGKASELRYSTIPKFEALLPQEGTEITGILHDSVSAADIEAVVSRQTGIPVARLMSGEIEKLIHVRYRFGAFLSLYVPFFRVARHVSQHFAHKTCPTTHF